MKESREKIMKELSRREFLKYAGLTVGAMGASSFFSTPNLFAANRKVGGHFKPACVGYTLIRSLDPALCAWIGEQQIESTMFNSLLRFDKKMNIVSDLAQSWTVVNDTTYRFKLFPGIIFHDGETCTADDVVFSLERVRDPKTGSPNQGKLNEVSEIKALDKYTVEITTKRPFAPLLAYLCNARTGTQIISRKAFEKYGSDFAQKPIGTGPFKMVDWKPGEKFEFVKHPQYFMKGLPYLDKVTEYIIPEESASTNAIVAGDVDLLSTVLFSDVKTLEGTKGIKVIKEPGLNCRFFILNCQTKPFDDIYARQAFAHSFNRKNLIDAVIYGEGVEIQGIIPPAIEWAYHPKLKAQTFDPGNARNLLKKSKYKKADLNFTILTWGTGWWKRWAEIVAAQASEVLDIQIKVEALEAGTVNTRTQKGDFTCTVWGWLGFVEPDEYAYENFHSKGTRNYYKYNNPKVDDLLDKARTTMKKVERAKYYNRAEEIIGEEAPAVFCFSNLALNALRDYVMDFVPIPFSAFGQQFDRVWLTK
jgi:peptide/nickel transport system substrate-binding protein